MKNLKTNSIDSLKQNRKLTYKAISIASLSAIVLGAGVGESAKAMITPSGALKFFGSSGGRVIRPSNMGSTSSSNINYPKVPQNTNIKQTVSKPITSTSGIGNGNKNYVSTIHIPISGGRPTKPVISSSRPSVGSNTSSVRPQSPSSSVRPQSPSSSVRPQSPSSSIRPSVSGSINSSTSGTTSKPGSTSTNKRPSVVSNGTLGTAGSLYDDTLSNNSTTTNTQKNKLTKKQKVAIVTAGSALGLGALTAIGVGVGVSETNKDKQNSDSQLSVTPVKTPDAPTNSSKVVSSSAGVNYVDSQA